jgi:hypothetical protein
MAKMYDVVAVCGTRTDRDTGEEKPIWKNCGAVFETPKGLSMKLDLVPVTSDGWFKFFEPKEQAAPKPASGTPAASSDGDFDDLIPFD